MKNKNLAARITAAIMAGFMVFSVVAGLLVYLLA